MKVLVYPEKTFEEFGTVRWRVYWEEVSTKALERSRNPDYELDIDNDLVTYSRYYKTGQEARKGAKYWHKKRSNWLAFGDFRIQKQAVDWYVEEDRVAEWTDIGEAEFYE